MELEVPPRAFFWSDATIQAELYGQNNVFRPYSWPFVKILGFPPSGAAIRAQLYGRNKMFLPYSWSLNCLSLRKKIYKGIDIYTTAAIRPEFLFPPYSWSLNSQYIEKKLYGGTDIYTTGAIQPEYLFPPYSWSLNSLYS